MAAGLAVGVATAVLTLAQAWLIAFAIFYLFALGSGLVGFDVAAPAAPFFVPAGADLWGTLTPTLLALALVFLLKGLLAWLNTWLGNRAAAAVKSQLRTDIARARLARPVDAGVSTGGLITLVTQGLDALDGYYSKYLPQLLLAATVPFIVGFAILTADLTSAVILALTLPLIPVFMILVGWTTQARTEKRWAVQTRLANHFADLVLGLPTLQVFGRAKAQAKGLLKTESAHRRETMATLRLSFMSALVLELLSTLSVAIVAVVVGFRVVFDTMDLRTALFVLILAPEAYLPVRQVGAHFHDSADGVAAAQQAFAIIGEMSEGAGGAVARAVAGDAADGTHHAEAPHRDSGDEAVRVEPSAVHGAPARRPPDDDPRIGQGAVSSRGRQSAVLSATGLSHTYPGASAPALEDFNLAVAPGEIVVLTGPSGCGKTTVLNAVMGFLTPTRGQLLGDGRPIADWAAWRGRVAYVGQNPGMVAGTVADNVRLGFPQATDLAVRAALDEAGAAELPLDHPVGMDGEGVSAG
ncbi:MAG: thiol reductant ABC exporter subunit CydD, partial [Propionibacteriaceae bacterium]|nr:thiol reductant ABC exporter subunit CydD [Propionibacteriaceae bacterium]